MHGFSLLFCLMAISAKETEFTLQADGFAVIRTFTLTPGEICRKLDRYESPVQHAWYTKDADQTIYLLEDASLITAASEKSSAKNLGCQREISRKTLVGPLKKDKWRIFGGTTTEVKTFVYSRAQEVSAVNGSYPFKLEKSAVVAVSIHYYRNINGGCYEYLPVEFKVDKEKSNVDLQVLQARAVERKRIATGHGLCRALPQTIARGAQQLPAGNYRLVGNDVKRVILYFAE